MIWSGLGTKITRLELVKDPSLALNTCFNCHKHGWQCSEVSLKISSVVMLTTIETQSRRLLASMLTTNPLTSGYDSQI